VQTEKLFVMGGTAQGGAKRNTCESVRSGGKNERDGFIKRESKGELISKVDKVVICVHKCSPNHNIVQMITTITFRNIDHSTTMNVAQPRTKLNIIVNISTSLVFMMKPFSKPLEIPYLVL
jgi:hypothetical protein